MKTRLASAFSFSSDGGMLKRTSITGLGFLVILVVLLGFYWSGEPAAFSVQQSTAQKLALVGNDYVVGSTTTVALITVAETLLNKPGGYLSNDISPPGLYLDNIPNW